MHVTNDLDEWRKKHNEATRLACVTVGPEPQFDSFGQGIVWFFISLLISCAALFMADISSDRGMAIAISVATAIGAIAFLARKLYTRRWYAAYGRYLNDLMASTKP